MSEKEMASNICRALINKEWHSYVDDMENVPEEEGIYVIGIAKADGSVLYLYTGHSIHVHTRFIQHRNGKNQRIDRFIKEQFRENGGHYLRMKWELRPDSKLKEGQYLNCIERNVGYRLSFNDKRGNGTPQSESFDLSFYECY